MERLLIPYGMSDYFLPLQDVDKDVIDSILSVQRDYIPKRSVDHYTEVW